MRMLVDSVSVLLAGVAAAERERRRAEAVLASAFAPSFNIVKLIAPGETQLSEVFRWLLDETETHGQGRAFRDLFVAEALGDEPDRWEGARISCEVPTKDGRGRIDLLLESRDGARCVAIENKPWAGWQARQLARYLDDQLLRRTEVRVHALIGGGDPAGELERHWAEWTNEPLPAEVDASGFDMVVAWIEACARAARPDKVRSFLFDLADHCRQSILSEPSMTETRDTADLILAGGEGALHAAHLIAAALPLALTREVARRAGGATETVGSFQTVRVTVDGVPLAFALFGVGAPWAGVTEARYEERLRGEVAWGKPEKLWPRWTYLKRLGGQGGAIVAAAERGDPATVAALIPEVARVLLGD